MKISNLLCALPALLLACPLTLSAQDQGYWRAASSTARNITGDIAIANAKMTIDLSTYTLAEIRKVTPAEAGAVFAAEGSGDAGGNLYRVNIPATRRFLHKNTLCGSEPTQWMVTNLNQHTLQIAFFSGDTMPTLTPDAMMNSTDLCGTFSYVR